MALSKIDTTNMIEDVPQSKLDNNINFRNIIINGGMDIAQRNTSVSGVSSTNGYSALDRFANDINSAGTWTISQSTDVPSGQGFAKSLKMDCTTANASLSAGSYLTVNQKFEGQNLQYIKKGTSSAESLTVSFWVKSNKTGTYIVNFIDHDNARDINKSYTISSASTWEKKTITIDGDTTGTLDNDNAKSFEVLWWLGAGTNYTSGTLATSWSSITDANRAVGQVNLADSTSNEWYITGVQLEAGTTASDFEFLPVDVNLQRCQRYFYKSFPQGTTPAQSLTTGNSGLVGTQGNYINAYHFPTMMRASPSITTFNPYASNSSFRQFATSNDFSPTPQQVHNDKVGWWNTSAFSGTILLHANLTAAAEL